MARYVKVATIAMNTIGVANKPADQSILEYEIAHVDAHIKQVLPDKPDLIVLPEVCDRPHDLSVQGQKEYYKERGDGYVRHMQEVAKANHCYIGFGSHRFLEDGTGRNSFYMIGRNGEIVGIYDKNHIVPAETTNLNILCGEDIAIFDCDFGRVGAILCFDLNFQEVLSKYKKADPDLMIFSSMFGGGLMKNFLAFDNRCYLVTSCAGSNPGDIINPLGVCLGTTCVAEHYVVRTLNLDYEVVHRDNHKGKFVEMKEKYGELIEREHIGYVGVDLLTYKGTDKTIKDILAEYDVITCEEYLEFSRQHRAKFTAKSL